MSNPIVFISYSHDTEEHRGWVLQLASDLRAQFGINVILDQWDLVPGQDISLFMQRGITSADRVLLICTRKYVEKAEAGSGGVGYERLIVTNEVVENIDTKKFIPVVRAADGKARIPNFLGPRLYVNMSDDASYRAQIEHLAREIHGVPAAAKPALGANPFSGEATSAAAPARTAGPTGVTTTGKRLLDDTWFEGRAQEAQAGLAKLGRSGQMEVRFALHEELRKSQIELLDAVQASEVRTFGWPIGIVLHEPELKPKPYSDGVRAEVLINRETGGFFGSSYDSWAIRTNGDFYLLQDLFEDQRDKKEIFFNTRIIRVTEALMFASSLYQKLGAASDTLLSARIAHRGFSGRTLGSATFNRHIWPKTATADVAETEIAVPIGAIREDLPRHVQRLLEPLFMLFDFTKFEDQIYDDIVRRFEKGEPT